MTAAPAGVVVGRGEVVIHRVVVAHNAVACATCGTVVAHRKEAWSDTRWELEAAVTGLDHTRFPAARPPGWR